MPRTLWAVVDEHLTLRQWGGEAECVAFSPLSGDVHLISVAAKVLLETLSRQPLDRDQLVVRLAEASARAVDDEWASAVDAALTMLDRAGLIEPRVS